MDIANQQLEELAERFLDVFPEHRTLNILLVDDDLHVADYLRSYLGRVAPCMTLEYARTVDAAEEVIAQRPESIDVLIIDLYMGEKGGIDFMKYLIETKRYYPFVVYSGDHAESEQSDVVPILRELSTREALQARIRESCTSFPGGFVSKRDYLSLLLLEILYRRSVFSLKHVDVFNEMCERLKPTYCLESPDERDAKALIETTASIINKLREFLDRFETHSVIVANGLNVIPETARSVRNYEQSTFTDAAREFYLNPNSTTSKPLLFFTMDELRQLAANDPGVFIHDIRRFELLLPPLKGFEPRNIATFYAKCVGLIDRDSTGHFEYPEKYKPAMELIFGFLKDIEKPCKRVLPLAEACATGYSQQRFYKWMPRIQIQEYLRKTFNDAFEAQNLDDVFNIYYHPRYIEFIVSELARNAEELNAEITRVTMGYKGQSEISEAHRQGLRSLQQIQDFDRASGLVELTLYDNGPGFNVELLSSGKYFEHGFSQTGSTGMGLNLLKGIVERMHGHLELGNYKKGGYVKVYLPAEAL